MSVAVNGTDSFGPRAAVSDAAVRAAEAALEREGLADAHVDLTFAGDERLRELNRTYRGIDRATDVLSFPCYDPAELAELRRRADAAGDAEAGGGDAADGPPLLLGEVVISVDRVMEQARAFGHSPEREAAFLAVHGVLHLAGYDHGDAAGEAAMRAATEAVLAPLGLTR